MNIEDLPQQSKKFMNKVTDAVEKTGKKVANQVSDITGSKAEEITETAIQTAVDKAIDAIQIASQRIREKEINGERVTLEVGMGITNVANLKITTDIPAKDSIAENSDSSTEADVEINQ